MDARRAMEWTRSTIATRRRPGWRPSRRPSSARASCSSTAARGTRSGSTSPPRRWRVRPRRDEDHAGLHGHTHLPIAYIEEDGRLETMSPGSGPRAEVRRAAGAAQPRQRGPAPRRHPDSGWMLLDTDAGTADLAAHGLRHLGRPGGDDAPGPAGAPRGAPGVRALADERRPSPHLRAASPATRRPGRAAPFALLPLHGTRPAHGEGCGQRPHDAARPLQRPAQARAPRPTPGQRGGDGRAPAQEEGALDLQLRRHLVIRLRDRGDPARTSSWWAPVGPRSCTRSRSASRSPSCWGSWPSATASVCRPRVPHGGGPTRCRRRTSGGSTFLIATLRAPIDYTMTVVVSTTSAAE